MPGPADEPTSTPLDRLDTVFRGIFAGFVVLLMVPLVSLAAAENWPHDRVIPLVLTLAATVMAMIRWPVVLPMLAMGTALAISIPEAPEAMWLAPRLLLGAIGFLIVLYFHTRSAILMVGITAAAYVGYSAVMGPPGATLAAIDDAVLTSVLTVTGTVFVRVLTRSGSSMERTRTDRIQSELAASFKGSGVLVAASTRRLLHDEVIGTLTAVADHRLAPTGADCGLRDAELKLSCARVADLLLAERTALGPSGPLDVVIARVVEHSDLVVDVAAGPEVELDTAQVDAVSRALAEALRNVRRHAVVDQAAIGWTTDGPWIELRVADHGEGPADAVGPTRGGFGLRHSISEPLAQIGGSASLAPGSAGSVLTLRWPATGDELGLEESPLEQAHRQSVRAIGSDQTLAMQVTVPVLAGNLWLALRHSWGDPAWLPELALVIAIAVVTLVVADRVRRAPLRPWSLVLLTVWVAASVHIALMLAGGPPALRDYNSFVIGPSALVLTVVAFYVPLGWSVVMTSPLVAVVVLQVILGGLSLGDGGGAINAAIAPPLLGQFFGAYLRWSRQRQDEDEKRIQEVAGQIHRHQVHEALSGRQLARARRMVGPWLGDVAAGRQCLHRHDTTSRARALSVAMRDDLHLPGLLDDVLCARIDRSRAAGTDVVLEAVSGEVEQTGPCLRLLDRVLDLGAEVERVQVRLPEAGRADGEVTVLPPLEGPRLHHVLRCVEGWEYRVRRDIFSTSVSLGDLQLLHDDDPRPNC